MGDHGRTGMTKAIDTAATLPRASTGIGGFDDMVFGGLPNGQTSPVYGSAGCGKTVFAITFPGQRGFKLLQYAYSIRDLRRC